MTRSTAEGAWIDLGPGADRAAETILEWPDDFIGSLRTRLLAIRAGTELSADDRDDLKVRGVLDTSSDRATALGEELIELLVHESWQEGSERRTFREMGIGDGGGSVLEIGCSTGWALRSLEGAPGGRRLGMDIDARALALAYRFSRLENQDCGFSRCSALSVPVDDEAIDFIICRNTLTYVDQRAALKEMSRVLKPNGRIFLRFENIWYDVRQVLHSQGVRSLGARLRDFGVGLIHAAVGWLPDEGSRLRWGRAFVALPRLRRILRDHGCEIMRIDESLRCSRFWGFSTQTSVLARKAGEPRGVTLSRRNGRQS